MDLCTDLYLYVERGGEDREAQHTQHLFGKNHGFQNIVRPLQTIITYDLMSH
jgi:hypothetical protein